MSAAANPPAIRTWRERIGAGPDFPLHAPNDVERAMEAEIAELRRRLRAMTGLADPRFDEVLELTAQLDGAQTVKATK